MTVFKSLGLLAVTACALLFNPSLKPASAQELGAWGMWGHWDNDKGRAHRTGRRTRSRLQGQADSATYSPNHGRVFPALMTGGPRPQIELQAPAITAFPNDEEPGTIIIDTKARRLYYTLNGSQAYEYPISVGRAGYTWTGTEDVSRIAYWPDWHPPKEMREREPGLPEKMFGGIRNPLGAVAIYLGETLYRIHGTNDPKTIGLAASSGCIRMLNAHAMHLAKLAYVGTTVKVVRSIRDLNRVSATGEHQDPRSGG